MTYRYAFLVNGFPVQLKLRQRGKGRNFEPVVIDSVLGEFALDGTEGIQAKDLRLAEALNYQPDDGFRAVALEQAVELLQPPVIAPAPKPLP